MSPIARNLRNFRSDDGGAITALMVILFIGILVATGAAVDLAKQEAERADLQASLDRGVLAAASLTQNLADDQLDDLVAQYVELRNLASQPATVTTTPGGITLTERDVRSSAQYDMSTTFLRFAGVSELTVGADARAVQSATEIEISLVLDISGSMREDARVLQLIPAAKNFVNVVTQSGTSPYTTVNLIRYAGQTNPGPWMFSRLGGARDDPWSHTESSCFYMDQGVAGDFYDADLPSVHDRDQVPHFMKWAIADDWMQWGWCPSDKMAIKYMVNDYQTLIDEIELIRPNGALGTSGNLHDGTGTYNAMKWAVALLNPSSQPIIAEMAQAGLVEQPFADRPARWDDEGTKKFIVLMTDGRITQQYDPNDKDEPSTVSLLAQTEIDSSSALTAKELFSRSEGVNYFYEQCSLAKTNGITVFTIAFEAPADAATEMRNCASTGAHFYEANQLNISQVFSQIATTIQRLRLIM